MTRATILVLALLTGGIHASFAGEAKGKANTLAVFVQEALATGSPSRVPPPISGLIGVRDDVPVVQVVISSEQATDRMVHLFKVIIEQKGDSKSTISIGLVVNTYYQWPGNAEGYWFRAKLDGTLEKAVVIHGKRDGQGRSIKGAGSASEKDIASPEIKERFRHELDLWLKRAYVKKEWKSAAFVGGALAPKMP